MISNAPQLMHMPPTLRQFCPSALVPRTYRLRAWSVQSDECEIMVSNSLGVEAAMGELLSIRDRNGRVSYSLCADLGRSELLIHGADEPAKYHRGPKSGG